MRNALLPILEFKLPRQLDLALDVLPTSGISTTERNAVIARLALHADGGRRHRDRGGRR